MFRKMILLLLALAWVPLTSHCRIEAMPGFEFLRCSTDGHASDPVSDPCDDGGCCAIESAKYQSPRPQDIIPVVLVAILTEGHLGVMDRALPAEVSLGVLTAAPPDLPASWQFLLRAALPVRAPSLAS